MSNAAVAAISVALYILLAPGVGGLLQLSLIHISEPTRRS